MSIATSKINTANAFVNPVNVSTLDFQENKSGYQIWYGWGKTMFGTCLIAGTGGSICNLYFVNDIDRAGAELGLRAEWSGVELILDQELAQEVGDRLFQPLTKNSLPWVLNLRGTEFQKQVWRALLAIPFGTKTTYQALAIAIGKPTAARAVGNAVGRNPISVLIPCHRVIRASGELGGFRWGMERKLALLEWEALSG